MTLPSQFPVAKTMAPGVELERSHVMHVMDQNLQCHENALLSWYSRYESYKLHSGIRVTILFPKHSNKQLTFKSAQSTNSWFSPQKEATLAIIVVFHL